MAAENSKTDLAEDGSVAGFDSLHCLLQSFLPPHLFQEASRLLIRLNCGKMLHSVALPEPAKSLSLNHAFDLQNSIAFPTTKPFLGQKRGIFQKLTPIIKASVASGVNILCLQEAWTMPFAFCTREFAEPIDGESTKFL
ncbi:beta-ureidopropionase [Salvia divinorum]|uniref:Beta-ureidopropionase n=1 Tax=Salvia divinorum TaxID=28513 RepID=A0ABD1I7D7_SALDI